MNSISGKKIYSIGHSSHSESDFIELLNMHEVNAIVDVRSAPYSNYYPHFSRENLKPLLRQKNISYVFLGKELGGRPSKFNEYEYGIANYEMMAKSSAYEAGITRVFKGRERFNVALMCSEHDPLDCHRCLLVSRTIKQKKCEVQHILRDGTLQTQTEIEMNLLKLYKEETFDLFASPEEGLNIAYKKRAMRVAYNETDNSNVKRATAL